MITRSIGDVIGKKVHVTVAPDACMNVVCRLFRTHHVGAIPVVYSGRLVGLIKRNDVTMLQFQAKEILAHQFATEFMSPVTTTIALNSSLSQAIATMIDHVEAHLPVIDRVGTVIGVLSLKDVPTEYQMMVERARGRKTAVPAE
ncbi:MAG: CBS domain-containing protein [Paracoccaceae bacterium]